jgi:methionyl aminopeptidase
MTIDSPHDLQGLLAIGRVVGRTLHQMRAQLRAGITTGELDALAADFLRQHGARSAPMLAVNFPGATCISINDEAAHGIPGSRVIQAGDVVKLDVSAELDGYYADAAITVPVPPVAPKHQTLCACALAALDAAIAAAQAGQPLYQIGRAAETVARRHGFNVIRELHSHGVGRALHEAPSNIPQFYQPQANQRMTSGLVITVEPHIAARSGQIRTNANGWTLTTRDRSWVAAYEHTIIITNDRPIIVTAA